MRSSLATYPTNAINTVHSYDPYILYQQSSGGHTSKPLNHYLRRGSFSAACSECPIKRSSLEECSKRTHTNMDAHTYFLCMQECIHIKARTSGSCSYNRWQIRITHTQTRPQFRKDVYLLSALWHSWADSGSLCFPSLTELSPQGFVSYTTSWLHPPFPSPSLSLTLEQQTGARERGVCGGAEGDEDT